MTSVGRAVRAHRSGNPIGIGNLAAPRSLHEPLLMQQRRQAPRFAYAAIIPKMEIAMKTPTRAT